MPEPFIKLKLTQALWHFRARHPGQDLTSSLLNGTIVSGIKMIGTNMLFVCPSCLVGKHQQMPYNYNKKRANNPCKLLHIDISGPFPTASPQEQKYMFTVLDDNITVAVVSMLHKKNDACMELEGIITKWENHPSTTVKKIHSDGAKEFGKGEMGNYMKTQGIVHQKTAPYVHPQNSKAERFIQMIENRLQTLMVHVELLTTFLADAILTLVYLYM